MISVADGVSLIPVQVAVYRSPTQPIPTKVGDLWIDTSAALPVYKYCSSLAPLTYLPLDSGGGGGGVADGDKGDIVVSGGGTIWTIEAGAITAIAAPIIHTHTSSQIIDFAESVDDQVASLLVAGTNVTLTYNDVANTLTIASTGGGGGSTVTTSFTTTISPAVYTYAEVTRIEPLSTSTSKINCWLSPNDDWDADDLEDIDIIATPEIGQIIFTINEDGPIVGDFTINYQVLT